MKKFSVTCIAICCFYIATFAQQSISGSSTPTVDTTTFGYFTNNLLMEKLAAADPSKHPRIRKLHNRWEQFWQPRASKDTMGSGIFEPAAAATFYALTHPTFCPSNMYRGGWAFLGPARNDFGASEDKRGRVLSVWVSPTNINYILAGAASGGLWKTIDGGQNWHNITDQIDNPQMPGTIGINQIAVHPTNQQFIYVGTGGPIRTVGGGSYSLGLMYSYNGGNNWNIDYNYRYHVGTNTQWGFEKIEYPTKIAFSPSTNHLYVIAKRKILKQASGTSTWQDITPTALSSLPPEYTLADFEFTQFPSGKIIFSTTCNNIMQYLFTLNESNNQWNTSVVHIPSTNAVFDIALTQNDKIYWSIEATGGAGRLYISNADGSGMTPRNSSLIASSRFIVASRSFENRIYLTNANGNPLSIQKSINGGVDWTDVCFTHADGRSILLYSEGNTTGGSGDILFAGTDGGVAKKNAGVENFHSISGEGLNITQFVNLSSNTTNSGMLTAGAIDNGTHAYNKDMLTPWSIPPGLWGDGLIGAFSRNGLNKAYTQTNDNVSSALSFTPGGPGQTPGLGLIAGPGDPPDAPSASGDFNSRWHRPMQVDELNRLKIGFHFIFRRDPAAWAPSFGQSLITMGEPKSDILMDGTHPNVDSVNAYKNPIDFIVSEKNPTIGYLAYENILWANSDFNYDHVQNLYSSINLGTTGQSWQKISPPILFLPITDIEIDPKQPNRIWVSYGSVYSWEIDDPATDRHNRIFYSDNYGATWLDVSKGLPMVPVMKLVFVEGSDDVLFAGTDVGVYRWNKSLNLWQCFNEGIPICMISGMEMNYCTGKLRVSTYGRGIWETDYRADVASFVPGDGISVISTNTTWNSSKTISASVRVKAGKTLTISGSTTIIHMPLNGRILVEPGAKLIVDGATITNECGTEWGGIELTGNRNALPDPANQGYCQLINGAKIMNAKRGIRNFTWDNGAQGGGIIKAENSTFINCKRSVELNDYPNYSYFYSGGSQCSFNNVDFIYNDQIPGGMAGSMFTSWNTYAGVIINNCRFNNQMSSNPFSDRGKAVAGIHTGIKIENSTFLGFSEAIRFEGVSRRASRVVSVFNNQFSSNGGSVMMAAASFGDIKRNTVNNLPGKGSYGFYLDRAYGSYIGCQNKVYGNYFGGGNNNGGHGTIVNGTLNEVTHIVNNEFYNLTIGTQTQLTNTKLHVLCNTYKDSRFGFFINPQTFFSAFRDQGTMAQPAGNKFINISGTGITSYTYVPWTYYRGSGANETPTYSGSALTVTSSPNANRCIKPFRCYLIYGQVEFDNIRNEYGTLVAAGQKDSEEGRMLFADLVRAYNHLDDKAGLQTFLESENDDEARKSLLSLYIETHQYAKVPLTLAAMSLSEDDANAYNNYYTLLSNLEQNDRRLDVLDNNERQIVEAIANNDNLELAPYAKAWMEYAFGIVWEHPIEEIPLTAIGKQIKLPPSSDALESSLFDAAPNPASKTTILYAFVNQMDFEKKAYFQIRDINGKELYRSEALNKGDNTVDVNITKFPSGIYLYSLISDTKAIATKKLSVQR
jgi:hypothetical protein